MTEEKLSKLWYELEDEEEKAEVEYCKMFNSTPEEVPLNEMVRFRSGYCMGRHYGYLAGIHEGQASVNSCGDWNNDVHTCQMYIRQEEIEKLAHENEQLKAQIEKMKSDVIKHFGDEYNVLVARLLKEWELKEQQNEK